MKKVKDKNFTFFVYSIFFEFLFFLFKTQHMAVEEVNSYEWKNKMV